MDEILGTHRVNLRMPRSGVVRVALGRPQFSTRSGMDVARMPAYGWSALQESKLAGPGNRLAAYHIHLGLAWPTRLELKLQGPG